MRTKDRMVEVKKAKKQPEFMFHFREGYVWSGRVGKEKIVFKMHILTAFEGSSTSGR